MNVIDKNKQLQVNEQNDRLEQSDEQNETEDKLADQSDELRDDETTKESEEQQDEVQPTTDEDKTTNNESDNEIAQNETDRVTNNEINDDPYASEFDEVSINDSNNIINTFTGNWAPIGTNQKNRTNLNFNEGSADRTEIRHAVSIVTGIEVEEMIEYWYQNGGDTETAIADVYDKVADEYYTVYLRWTGEEGWQVRKVEQIYKYKQT